MKLLVITSEPFSAQQLRDAIHRSPDSENIEVALIAPALHDNPLRFWLSDADDAITRAAHVSRRSLARLEAEGISVHADTGEGDPLEAIEDTLQTFDADRIVLFSHAPDEQRYREAIDANEVERRFSRPVDHALVGSRGAVS